MIVARILLLATAIAVCAWFALGVRETNDQAQATKLLDQHLSLTSGQAREADRLIRDALTLNPDQALNILRARVKVQRRDLRGAATIAEAVTRQEPENADAWSSVEFLTRQSDPALSRLAQARVGALAPPVPPAP